MVSVTGYGAGKRIAFLDTLPAQPGKGRKSVAVLTGGEWDALALQQAGFHAVSSTGGEGAVPHGEDLRRLAGWPIRVLLDTDAAGREGAIRLCAALEGIALDIKDVCLPLPKDATDWFVTHGNDATALIAVMRSAPVWGQRRGTEALLRAGLKRAEEEPRNAAGFWLACQLRDERYTREEAGAVLVEFQREVASAKQPPYTPEEASSSLVQAFSRPPRNALGGEGVPYRMTDLGNAERLVDRHGDDMRWVQKFRDWAVWSGRCWDASGTITVERWAKETARALVSEAAQLPDGAERKQLHAHAVRSESAAKVRAMIEMARSEPGIAIEPDAFDRDPWLFNCANGALDLRTGVLQDHARADMARRISDVAYDPKASAPRWASFLRRVLPDAETRAFLQRAVGYSLTGSTSEQKLLLMYGFGANGKTTFCETVKEVLGDYGQQMPFETLLEKRYAGIPNDVARLDGARFVLASESKDGDRFNEQLVKQLTGGDTMTARFLHAEFFDFRPQCTVWLRTNHRPVVRGTDDAIWRRFLMVPFEVQIPEDERDDSLPQQLLAELPGVLAWAVEGCLAWQRQGLAPPAEVQAATDAYRNDSDVMGTFFEECCTLRPDARVMGGQLFDTYRNWSRDAELVTMSKVSFGKKMKERGFEQIRMGEQSARGWAGLTHKDAATPSAATRTGKVILLDARRDR
jgi:putative DNA primase/helicase